MPNKAEALLCTFLDLWLERFDALANQFVRRQNAMALSAVLALPVPGILSRVEGLMDVLIGVWEDVGPASPSALPSIPCN